MGVKAKRSERLTKALVRGLKPEEKRYCVFDTDLKGFFVQVDVTGSKVFRIRRMFKGRLHQPRVGNAKVMVIEEAREKARQMLRDVDLGKSPDGRDGKPTFAEVVALTRAGASYSELSEKSRVYYDGYLDRLALPELGETVINEIDRASLKQFFELIYKNQGRCGVHGTRSAIGKVFEYAMDAGWVAENPAKGMKRFGKRKVRDRLLQPSELRLFWLATGRSRVSPDIRDALRLCVLTALRRAEIAEATWGEIDFDRKLWTVPVQRTKRKLAPYNVPISPAAESILLARLNALEQPAKADERIFSLRPDSLTQSMAKLTSKAPFDIPFTPHDLRRTLVTSMSAYGVPEELLERVLNHTPDMSRAIRSYNHNDYARLKREILNRWAAFVDDVVEGKITCLPNEFSHQ